MFFNVSIVLITCNRVDTALPCIASLLTQQVRDDVRYELVIVNDGSKDDTAKHLQRIVESSHVPVRVVTTTGVGVPAARNLGARQASSSWIACFDDDQIASPGWLQALIDTQKHSGARCVGGALQLRFVSGATPALNLRARRLLGEHLHGKSAQYRGGVLPASNNVLVERDLMQRLGGFDEGFHQGGSDTEFFSRIRNAGELIWYAEDAVAFHLIPDQRLGEDYFRWVAMKVGATQARILLKQRKRFALTLFLTKRAAGAAARDVPQLLLGYLRRTRAKTLDARCSLWFSQGLARASFALVLPRHRRGNRFLDSLNFRRHNGERAETV